MEQLHRSYGLPAGLEGRELNHHRPTGGDDHGAQHAEAGTGPTTWTPLPHHNEGLSVYNYCLHR